MLREWPGVKPAPASGTSSAEGDVRGFPWCLLVLSIIAVPAAAGSLDEVPAGHWSYAAVDVLMQRGLVHGYQAAPYSGPTPLTRAEMAGIVARAVRGVGEAMQERGRRLELLAQAPPQGAPPEAAADESGAAPAVTPEDLARIEKLLAEFRNELVVMGAKVDGIAAALAQLRAEAAETRKQVDELAREVARHRISGFAQMRYTLDGSAAPESEFAVRRARLALSGPLSERASYKLELDAPTQERPGESSAHLTQAYAALDLGKARVLAGQFPLPFGWELFTPDSDLAAPERALGVGRLLPDQRYDRGVGIEGSLGDQWRGWLAVVNGTGSKRGDTNDRKDLALRLAHASGTLEYGVSGYYGKDTQPATDTTPRADANRHLGNAFVIARRGPAQLKGEIIAGKAAVPGAIAEGAKDVLAWTVLGGYAPCPKTNLAIRFHRFDPDRDTAGDSTDTTALIWMHWLDDAVRLRLAEEFVRPDAGGSHSIFITELQIIY